MTQGAGHIISSHAYNSSESEGKLQMFKENQPRHVIDKSNYRLFWWQNIVSENQIWKVLSEYGILKVRSVYISV